LKLSQSKVPDIPQAQEECQREFAKVVEELWLEKAMGENVDDFLDTALLVNGLLKFNPINVPIDASVISELRERLEDWCVLFATKEFEGPTRIKMEQINIIIGNL